MARAAAGGRRSASCEREAGARERGRGERRQHGSTAGGDALVPLDGHALDAFEGQGGGRLPVLRAAQDQVVQRVLRKEGTTRRDEQLPRTWEAKRAWATAEKRARMRLF